MRNLFSIKNKLISAELMFFAAIAISFLFEFVFGKFQIHRILNFVENFLFALLLVLPMYLIKGKKIKKYYFLISFLFFNIILFIETSYYYVFNVNISPSSIYVFLETNYIEASEFLSFYINEYLILYGLLLCLLIVSVFFIKRVDVKYENSFLSKRIQVFFCILILFIIIKETVLRHQNLPYLVLKSFYVVYYESGVINSDVYHTDTGKFKNVKVSNNRNNKLYVIVIGESTTSRNMSLYGYNRTTNPLLSRQKDLSVFDNVISPHAGTTASITKSLSLKNFENSSMSFEGSIMQLLNAANYDTYWISNQQPVGFAETDITKIVYANRNKIYLNTEGTEEFNQYDDVIFDQIDSVISEESDTNKVLFIHIQGNHFYYKNRYPDSFNVFKENQKLTVATKQNEFNIINEYDNAVVYNDFIINKIINKVKNKKTESFLLYFSDHGEEVYHTIKFAGHNDDVGTLPMFQIPFLLWRSKNYIEKNNIQIDLERGYMTDDLFHSIADLCAVNNINVDLERSIFSNKFKERKRVILGNKDYDSLLSIENNRKK